MPEAEAEQPEFQKRPLWEYKGGEEVDGTVAALRQRAVFVDVGAMVDAYFPEENWGAMKGKMEVGQKLKFRIEKVTGCRMTLTEAWAKPRGGKMCRLHGLDWDESAGAIASIQHCPAHWGLLLLSSWHCGLNMVEAAPLVDFSKNGTQYQPTALTKTQHGIIYIYVFQ